MALASEAATTARSNVTISKFNFTTSGSVFAKPTSARSNAWGVVLRPLPDNDPKCLFQAVDDERSIVARHAFVNAAERGRVVVRRHTAKACRDGDILLAADGV